MKQQLALWLDKVWYNDPATAPWLRPLGWIYRVIATFRRYLYRANLLKQHRLPVPVVIVGNISVGGTGKTPLIIWIAQLLKTNGFKPGIISRGYGGTSETWPQQVTVDSDVTRVGDEALLIARHANCPMAVGPKRVKAAGLLLEQTDCDVILSDDGLQHYALGRDVEIAVIDGDRLFGNGFCLPAGPLRESQHRIDEVDFVVVNGTKKFADHYSMQMEGTFAVNLLTREVKSLQSFTEIDCHAVAGIGNPDRFFFLLKQAGLTFSAHKFPDHHVFKPDDLEFSAGAVLMTEKDAVKCEAFARAIDWYVPVVAAVEPDFKNRLLTLLREKQHG